MEKFTILKILLYINMMELKLIEIQFNVFKLILNIELYILLFSPKIILFLTTN